MGVIAFGILLTSVSLTTADNTTQTGESIIATENNVTQENVIPTAGVATIQYDVFSKQMTPEKRLADVKKNGLVLSTIAPTEANEDVEETETAEEPEGANEETNAKPEETRNVNESNEEVKPEVDEEELYMLSHLIYAEAGSEKCSDTTRYYVGSVVLNRMKSDLFKEDTMKGVIFAKGQYSCTWIGTYYNEPTERCIEIARDLLENGSVLPENVVFQAEFKQGDGVYDYIDNTYFCYKN